MVKADLEQGHMVEVPRKCPSDNECKSTRFEPISSTIVCRDLQEIRVQEQVASLTVGSIPRSISVILEDDLVDKCKAGDDVMVHG
jgi:DNA helicase MCM9